MLDPLIGIKTSTITTDRRPDPQVDQMIKAKSRNTGISAFGPANRSVNDRLSTLKFQNGAARIPTVVATVRVIELLL